MIQLTKYSLTFPHFNNITYKRKKKTTFFGQTTFFWTIKQTTLVIPKFISSKLFSIKKTIKAESNHNSLPASLPPPSFIHMGCTNRNWICWQLLGIFQILPILFISSICRINGLTPQSPIQCNKTICTLQNSYGTWGDRKNCYALNVTYPTTEEQLRLAVSYVVQNNLKAKIVTKFAHTIPKLACPQQKNNALFISTEKYDSGIQIDVKNLAVTVDSGVGLRQLIDEVERNGFSLVAAPYWEGVTIGGLISTGAHGSSLWGKGGSVHDHVLGISIVVPASKSEGFAKILWLEGKDPLLNAAKVSLGVLGAISKVGS